MADVIGQRVAGNLVYIDRSAHLRRIIDAIGPDVIKHIDDFVRSPLSAADAPLGWIVTLVEAGGGETTVTMPDVVGGALLISSDANDNDGACLQLDGESFELTSDQKFVYFRIKLRLSDATQSDFFVGLGITDTDPLGGISDAVYFEKLDGSTSISAVTEKDSTETQTDNVGVAADATDIVLEIYFEPSTVFFYVNGVLVATHTTNIPNDEALTPTIQFLAGAAGGKTAQIDEVVAIQVGR
jgi:hypothetical protein